MHRSSSAQGNHWCFTHPKFPQFQQKRLPFPKAAHRGWIKRCTHARKRQTAFVFGHFSVLNQSPAREGKKSSAPARFRRLNSHSLVANPASSTNFNKKDRVMQPDLRRLPAASLWEPGKLSSPRWEWGAVCCLVFCFCFKTEVMISEQGRFKDEENKQGCLFVDSGDSGSPDIAQTTCMSCFKEGIINRQTSQTYRSVIKTVKMYTHSSAHGSGDFLPT